MNIENYKNYKEIIVIGHKNPDVDTIVSSKILSEIFNSYGIKSNYAVIEENYPDEYNRKIINSCMEYKPLILKKLDIPNHRYFLVDHNDLTQSIGDKSLVIGAIDHHPDTYQLNNVIFSSLCCVSLFVYKLFKDTYNFSEEQKKQIYMAFLSDSDFGMSSRYHKRDEKLVTLLGFNNNYKDLFYKYFIPTDLSKGIEIGLINGKKSHDFGEIEFDSAYIESLDTKYLNEYEKLIRSQRQNFLGIWFDYEEEKTYAFLNFKNDFKVFFYSFIASRATTILKDVTNYINNLDK